MGKPVIPQSKSPLLKVLPCPATIINISGTETPLFGTRRRDLHASFLPHTFVQQLYTRSARTGTWHAFTWNTRVSHKPARNSQNHNISLVILLGLLPTPMECQLQSLTGILHLGFRHLVTHMHSNTATMFWPYIIIFLHLSLWFWKVIWHLWAADIPFSYRWQQNNGWWQFQYRKNCPKICMERQVW